MSARSDPPTGAAPRPAEPVPASDPRVEALRRLIGVVDRLRAPDGCPWDREQTEATIAPHALEEAHEWVEAIESGSAPEAAGEAGDVLMNVVLASRIASETGRYDLAEVAERTVEKLVRRHPHVFGERRASSAQDALASWEAVKRAEREEAGPDASALAGVPKGLAALQRAGRVCEKAVAAGFRWQDASGALAKVREELRELEEELPSEALSRAEPSLAPDARRRAGDELGDLLLATAFLARYLGLDAEALCRASLRRFEARFRRLESELGPRLREAPLQELTRVWESVK